MFRLQRNANSQFRAFLLGDGQDTLVTIEPSAGALRAQAALRPCRVRLVKYTLGGTDYALATTLLDRKRYAVAALADLCTTVAGASRNCTRCRSNC